LAQETRSELIEKYEWLIEKADMGEFELNDWELQFLDDQGDFATNLYAEDGFLTDRQIEKLEEIYEKYNDR
jgi:hypothetical protein